jgi:hypothetical protein
VLHVFAACDAPADYVRRLRVASESFFVSLGVTPRAPTAGD